jgi:predicted nucleic acid-binding protein
MHLPDLSVTPSQLVSTNVWSDGYLAAFAQAADLEVVTFDKGFAQYTDLRQTILS